MLADASALLGRLELRNIEVGGRWRQLADWWQVQTFTGARPFYIVHAMMAFVAAGRDAAAARVLETLPCTDGNAASAAVSEDVLAPLFCEALLAFSRSDYDACVDWLTRARHIAHRCAASICAQRQLHPVAAFTVCVVITLRARRCAISSRSGSKFEEVARLRACRPRGVLRLQN